MSSHRLLKLISIFLISVFLWHQLCWAQENLLRARTWEERTSNAAAAFVNSKGEHFEDVWKRIQVREKKYSPDMVDPRTWLIESEEERVLAEEYSRLSLDEFAERHQNICKEGDAVPTQFFIDPQKKHSLLAAFIDELSEEESCMAHYFRQPLGRIKTVLSSLHDLSYQRKLTPEREQQVRKHLSEAVEYKVFIRELVRRWSRPQPIISEAIPAPFKSQSQAVEDVDETRKVFDATPRQVREQCIKDLHTLEYDVIHYFNGFVGLMEARISNWKWAGENTEFITRLQPKIASVKQQQPSGRLSDTQGLNYTRKVYVEKVLPWVDEVLVILDYCSAEEREHMRHTLNGMKHLITYGLLPAIDFYIDKTSEPRRPTIGIISENATLTSV